VTAEVQLQTLLDEATLSVFRRLARSVSYPPGTSLLRQGQAAKGAIFIEKGQVDVRVAMPGGGALEVARLGPGSVIGEMVLLEQGVCSATVVARSGVDALVIERDDFRALVTHRDAAVLEIQHAVVLMLCRKLRALNGKLLACDAPEDEPEDEPAHEEPACDPLEAVARKRSASFEFRRFLPVLPLFREFSEEDVDEVVSHARVVELPRGHMLFVAGQPAAASYIVVRGAIEVSATRSVQANGGGLRRRRIAVLGPGEWVGAMSMLDRDVHGSSARARESCVLLELDRNAFDALYFGKTATGARLQRALHRSLLGSLKRTNNHLTRLISQARIRRRRERPGAAVAELESALYGQIWQAVPETS
jgi:CRP-like cAMP-binding protein